MLFPPKSTVDMARMGNNRSTNMIAASNNDHRLLQFTVGNELENLIFRLYYGSMENVVFGLY